MAGRQTLFGAGTLVAIPSGTNPTPINFGILQGVDIDESFEVKELYGSNQFPEDIGRGKAKIQISAKIAAVDPIMFNSLFYNSTLAGGEIKASIAELAGSGGAIPGSPYALTVSNSATYATDLGVYNTTTGRWMTRVASAPATGQYSIAAGVYTFAAADTTNVVQISYTYTVASATGVGSTITIANTALGNAPAQVKLVLNNVRATNGKQYTQTYNSITTLSRKLSFKNDDFLVTDLSFQAFADSSGNIGTLSANGTN